MYIFIRIQLISDVLHDTKKAWLFLEFFSYYSFSYNLKIACTRYVHMKCVTSLNLIYIFKTLQIQFFYHTSLEYSSKPEFNSLAKLGYNLTQFWQEKEQISRIQGRKKIFKEIVYECTFNEYSYNED